MNRTGRDHSRRQRLLPLLATAVWAALAPGLAKSRPESSGIVAVAKASVAPDMSDEVMRMRLWVTRAGDHHGMPFFIIDKARAHLWPFGAAGDVLDHTPVLLGLARGDHTVPGIGEREIDDIRPHERTTPAGRFMAEAGRNLKGEDVVWLDYDAAVSMHRVRTGNPADRRQQRLTSPTPADNRISYGCVNVPAAFYNHHIQPLFRVHRAAVYVLPDTLPLERVFGGFGRAPSPR